MHRASPSRWIPLGHCRGAIFPQPGARPARAAIALAAPASDGPFRRGRPYNRRARVGRRPPTPRAAAAGHPRSRMIPAAANDVTARVLALAKETPDAPAILAAGRNAADVRGSWRTRRVRHAHDSPAGASSAATSSSGPMASGRKPRSPWPRCRRARRSRRSIPRRPSTRCATSSSGCSRRRSSCRAGRIADPARGARARPHRARGRSGPTAAKPAPSTSSSRVAPHRSNARPARASEWACLGATSGTTGRPKIVPHGHVQVLATARATGERLALGPGDILGHLMPLHLAGGMRNGFFQPLLNGAAVNVLPTADLDAFVAAVAAGEVTCTSASFSMLRELLARLAAGMRFERGRLRYVRVASGRLEPAEMDELEQRLGVPVITGLASSEGGTHRAAGVAACARAYAARSGRWSTARSGWSTRRAASSRRARSARSQVRGPQVFDGYLRRSGAQCRVLRRRLVPDGRPRVLRRRRRAPSRRSRQGADQPRRRQDLAVGDRRGAARVSRRRRRRRVPGSAPAPGRGGGRRSRAAARARRATKRRSCSARATCSAPTAPRVDSGSSTRLPRTDGGKIRRGELPAWVGYDPATASEPAAAEPAQARRRREIALAALWASVLRVPAVPARRRLLHARRRLAARRAAARRRCAPRSASSCRWTRCSPTPGRSPAWPRRIDAQRARRGARGADASRRFRAATRRRPGAAVEHAAARLVPATPRSGQRRLQRGAAVARRRPDRRRRAAGRARGGRRAAADAAHALRDGRRRAAAGRSTPKPTSRLDVVELSAAARRPRAAGRARRARPAPRCRSTSPRRRRFAGRCSSSGRGASRCFASGTTSWATGCRRRLLQDEVSDRLRGRARGPAGRAAAVAGRLRRLRGLAGNQPTAAPAAPRRSTYWKQRLADLPVLALPTDYRRPPAQSFRGGFVAQLRWAASAPPRSRRWRAARARRRSSAFLAAFAVLLSRLSGDDGPRDRDPGGRPARARARAGDRLLRQHAGGPRRPLRQPDDPRSCCARTRDRVLRDARARRRAVREAGRRAGHAARPVAQPAVPGRLRAARARRRRAAFRRAPLRPARADRRRAREVRPHARRWSTAPDGVGALWEYCTDLFDRETIERMARQYETLVRAMAAAPDRPVATLPLMDEATRDRLLAASIAPGDARSPPSPRSTARFAEQVRAAPRAPARSTGSTTTRSTPRRTGLRGSCARAAPGRAPSSR